MHMLVNQIACDVTFRFDESSEAIPAHKYVLISRSCVFYHIFSNEEITDFEIHDVEIQIFKLFLRFLYTDMIDCTFDNVSSLLHLAKRYRVSNLRKRCLRFLQANITPETVCPIMERAHRFQEIALHESCLNFVKRNGEVVLKSKGIQELCHDCFNKIIMADDLNASEERVLMAALFWSESECRREEREITPADQREVLGESIKYIRFPLLDRRFFVLNVSPVGILNDVETNIILEYYICPEKGADPFSSRPRIGQDPPDPNAIKRKPVLPAIREGSSSSKRGETPKETPKKEEPKPLKVLHRQRYPTKADLLKHPVAKTGPKPKPPKQNKDGKEEEEEEVERDTLVLRFPSRDEFYGWKCPGNMDDAIAFKCNEVTTLTGFVLFSPIDPDSGHYVVRAILVDNSGKVVPTSTFGVRVNVDPEDVYYEIPFPTPVTLQPSVLYTLVVSIKGSATYQGKDGFHTVLVGDRVFTFHDTLASRNGTNRIGGQIPGLLVRL
ncbi:BTB/POZ domain-containing protein 6-like [Gigantopelta aegis]|uniref:BTB/POZ domain-containing protein 6-like n=1 Tax=Gigantopelta aegis TaxID=1735272 RepID=UPI001B889236|nr:BTB/POZ domain-containing protein 6-like [Gigantopelta aegis]